MQHELTERFLFVTERDSCMFQRSLDRLQQISNIEMSISVDSDDVCPYTKL